MTFGLGWLAIIGVPRLSGLLVTKDKIIEAAFVGDGWRPWVFGLAALLGAGITAFYMSRLYFMTFQGKKRWTDDVHPHESPLTMTVPMMVLPLGSALLGVVLVPDRPDHRLARPGPRGEAPRRATPVPAGVRPASAVLTLVLVLLWRGILLA